MAVHEPELRPVRRGRRGVENRCRTCGTTDVWPCRGWYAEQEQRETNEGKNG
jgi:hypothetical protein